MALPQVTRIFAPIIWGWLADQTGQRLACPAGRGRHGAGFPRGCS